MTRAHLAKALVATQRFRDQEMGEDLFGDPAWDILLDLYQADLCGKPLSSSSVGRLAGIAPTTVLRWLAILEQRTLVRRIYDQQDRRRVIIVLTYEGRASVERTLDYLAGFLSAPRTNSVASER